MAKNEVKLVTINQETPKDWWEVEALFDLCFAPGREALSSYRLRDGVDPIADLCLVMRDGSGVLAAAVRFWPVRIAEYDTLLLGPIAVHPTRQGEGLSALLMAECLDRAAINWQRVILIGDAPYYARFGFRKLDGVNMPPPTNPERVLGVTLGGGDWGGIQGDVRVWNPPEKG